MVHLKKSNYLLRIYFSNFDVPLTFPWVMLGPTQNLDPIGSAVLTNGLTNRQTDKESINIDTGDHTKDETSETTLQIVFSLLS